MDYSKEYEILKCEHVRGQAFRYPSFGTFQDPTPDEVKRHSVRPFKMFRPTDNSYSCTFYSEEEILKAIEAAAQNRQALSSRTKG